MSLCQTANHSTAQKEQNITAAQRSAGVTACATHRLGSRPSPEREFPRIFGSVSLGGVASQFFNELRLVELVTGSEAPRCRSSCCCWISAYHTSSVGTAFVLMARVPTDPVCAAAQLVNASALTSEFRYMTLGYQSSGLILLLAVKYCPLQTSCLNGLVWMVGDPNALLSRTVGIPLLLHSLSQCDYFNYGISKQNEHWDPPTIHRWQVAADPFHPLCLL